MGYACFYLAVVTACLLWSAAFTAAAAKTARNWRWLLVAVAILGPVFIILPALVMTGLLAFGPLPMITNWFGPTLTAFLAALSGGSWIAWAGLARSHDRPLPYSSEPLPLAIRWPLVGLAAMSALAAAVAFGTLLILDNAVAAQAPYLRLEAAALIQAGLPPTVPDSQNAAPLYEQACGSLRADPAAAKEPDSLLRASETIDPFSPAATELLARHTATLDLLRRAADRDTCRFQKDWTRPSIDMAFPELQALVFAARLLSLEARREAADGNTGDALRDVVRLHRISRHAGSGPFLISALIGSVIDRTALDTLTQVLPTLRKSDLATLDTPEIRDLVMAPPGLTLQLRGEEATLLTLYADLLSEDFDVANYVRFMVNPKPLPVIYREPMLGFTRLFRSFFLPADLAGCRAIMQKYQEMSGKAEPHQSKLETEAVEAAFQTRSPGMHTSLLVPAVGDAFRWQAQQLSLRRAAAVLLAATRQRLESGTAPATIADLAAKPAPPTIDDPFAAGELLRMKQAENALLVYSVGPDGEDDGGPVTPSADATTNVVEGNDDVGLRMAL
jgi:hypothetical protein